MEFILTHNQQQIFDRIEDPHTHNNYLVCGEPGTGKSVLINALTELGNKTYTLAAPTGLAALNIGGKTLHSLFRLPVSGGIIAPDFNRFILDDNTLNNIKYNVKYLIIDEVSMVRADMFDYIDRLLRFVKGKQLPFGGVQLILIGDFYQLPPVMVGNERTQLKQCGYESPFIFSSQAYMAGNFEILQLNEILRQKGDPKFIKILGAARIGFVDAKQLATLNKQVLPIDDVRIRLAGRNKQADEINMQFLNALSMPLVTFTAEQFGQWPAFPCEPELRLKVGAQVMVKQNGADRPPKHKGKWHSDIVNGTLGVVIEIFNPEEKSAALQESQDLAETAVVIELRDGTRATIFKRRWERKIKEHNAANEWEERVVASYTQMPLALAWAISIHKSQGQSFSHVHIDASSIFAAGQLYVALSRCRTLDGITFASKLTQRKFFADADVVKFFETLNMEV